jgi:hypothetical protein
LVCNFRTIRTYQDTGVQDTGVQDHKSWLALTVRGRLSRPGRCKWYIPLTLDPATGVLQKHFRVFSSFRLNGHIRTSTHTMHSLILHFVLPTLLMAIPSSASQLFATDSRGNVSTLLLTESGNTSSLTVTSVTADCGPNPASLNLDYQNRILYCLDRGRAPGTEGSLNSLRIAADGSLSRIARVSAPFSGVAAEFFNDEETGVRGYVSTS